MTTHPALSVRKRKNPKREEIDGSTPTMTHAVGQDNGGWLTVSTEGFAQQNAARPPEHLVKELIQNSLDALPATGGQICVNLMADEQESRLWVECYDNGSGVEDLENLRTVFWTSKKDSHLKRGRMGRGFKELLCLAKHAEVTSRGRTAVFEILANGNRSFKIEETPMEEGKPLPGTAVCMLLPWDHDTIVPTITEYLHGLLIPEGCHFLLDGKILPTRPATGLKTVRASLTTETFEDGRWVKPQKQTQIELVPIGESHNGPGLIFEMGIPVCPCEWDAPYHANILQRVPMNPNRDAVMSGYAAKLHLACLPTLAAELDGDTARSAWVGEAAAKSNDPELQKHILATAFGTNIARSVPDLGKFSHDADAQELTGATILHTRQLSGGLRELAKLHVPTSKEVADKARGEKHDEAAEASRDPFQDDHAPNARTLMAEIGRDRIRTVCEFQNWLADQVLTRILPHEAGRVRCKIHIGVLPKAEATWSDNFQIYTLSLTTRRIWSNPLHPENLSLLVHETAHELAAHHGRAFATAMEQTAGAALASLFENPGEVAAWKDKLENLNQTK